MRGVCFRRGVSSACVLGFSIAAAPAAAQVIDPPAAAPAEPSVAPETWTYSGGSVPTGYHVEQQPRRGLVTAGALTLGIPWALGVAIASSRDFSNQSAWLPVQRPLKVRAARSQKMLEAVQRGEGPQLQGAFLASVVGLKVPVGKYQVVFRNDTF